MNEEELLKRLRSAFRLEADERLANMSSGLLGLEKAKDPESQADLVEEVFREAHSLKGAARAVNLKEIESLAQVAESVLAGIKRREIALCTELFDTLHDSVNAFENCLANIDEDSNANKEEMADVTKRLMDWRDGKSDNGDDATDQAGEAQEAAEDAAEQEAPEQAQAEDDDDDEYGGLYDDDVDDDDGADGYEYFDEDENPQLGAAATEPGPEPGPEPEPEPKAKSKAKPKAKPKAAKKAKPAPAKPADEAPKPAAAKKPRQGETASTRSQIAETVRIATSKLDSILLKAEELVSLKLVSLQHSQNLKDTASGIEIWEKKWARFKTEIRWLRKEVQQQNQHGENERSAGHLAQIMEFLDWNQGHVQNLGHEIRNLTKASEQDHRNLSRFADDLLDEVKRVTMLPFSTLFDGFPRMIRDISRNQNKEVDLILQGGEIEIDRRILEQMKSPFIHLLRNSVDHGLETPEERVASGKHRAGTINLTVSQDEGGKVEILLKDDGGGINFPRLKEKALKKGIITQQEAEQMQDQEAISLIFRSEISTSPIITEISGRGLGMAIVAETVEKLGGVLSVETEEGMGTSFKIGLPVTLATFRGVLIEAEKRPFIVPGAQVERVLRLPREEIQTVENRASVTLNDQVLSVANLGGVLSLEASLEKDREPLLTLVIMAAGDKRMAFSVDQVVCEQEVVVKSLGRQLARVPNVAGATILGSGKVVPVLNVSDLMKSAALSFRAAMGEALEGGRDSARKRTILIAEDSITSRMLIKNILEAAGYVVTTAVDGLEAYNIFETGAFDAVVSDVEMPRMNGFELTAKIRGHQSRAETPVVLVTSLDSKEDKERGIEVGANAYIVKASFDQSNLLEVIDRLI